MLTGTITSPDGSYSHIQAEGDRVRGVTKNGLAGTATPLGWWTCPINPDRCAS